MGHYDDLLEKYDEASADQFETEMVKDGARKDDSGKADMGYLEFVGQALMACSEVWEGGYRKYGKRGGWLKVDDGIRRYHAAMLRHAIFYPSLGETRDHELSEIMGKPILHKACVAVNALMELELTLREMNGESTFGNAVVRKQGEIDPESLVSYPEPYKDV